MVRVIKLITDVDCHLLCLKAQDDKDMFDLAINCNKMVVHNVISLFLSR